MGNGIAHVFAQHGYPVCLSDLSETALSRAHQTISRNLDRQVSKGLISEATKQETLSRITTTVSLEEAAGNASLIVEAATEQEETKRKIFEALDKLAPPQAILASNTSSISITRIAAATKRPSQVIGMHFMNPVPVMKLVEIISGYQTSEEVARTIEAMARELGKVPCLVNDYPGFVANRILMPMINEAVQALFEGVAGVEEIDTVMMLGMAHPMGPLQLADFIGLDVCVSIMEVLYSGLGHPKYAPCPLLRNMVAAGRLGVKSGEGFYRYKPGKKEKEVSPSFRK